MATQPRRREEEPKAAVPAAATEALPAELIAMAEQDAGRGVSTDQADNIVPLIYVLQALSPQVDENGPSYIDGARAGSIWLRNYSRPIIPGDEGIVFQPCHFWKDWVQWVPRDRGGGLTATYPDRPEQAREEPDPRDPRRTIWRMPNGDDLIETRHHAGFVIMSPVDILPYVINFSGTGHTTSKNWMFAQMSKHLPSGAIAPSYMYLYRLRTRQRSNAKGKWYVLVHEDAGVVDREGFLRGRQLFEAFLAGEKVAEAPIDAGAAGNDGGDAQQKDEIPF